MGRKPKIEVNDEFFEKVEELAHDSLTTEKIHNYFGISSTQWYGYYCEKYPELPDIISKGRSKGTATVISLLMKNCKAGKERSIIYFLDRRGGPEWRAMIGPELPGDSNVPRETTKLPPNDPIEAAKIYRKFITEG